EEHEGASDEHQPALHQCQGRVFLYAHASHVFRSLKSSTRPLTGSQTNGALSQPPSTLRIPCNAWPSAVTGTTSNRGSTSAQKARNSNKDTVLPGQKCGPVPHTKLSSACCVGAKP